MSEYVQRRLVLHRRRYFRIIIYFERQLELIGTTISSANSFRVYRQSILLQLSLTIVVIIVTV